MSKYHYNFDEIIDRTNTYSEKWDEVDKIFLNSNLLPLWVADMDFLSPPPIIDAFIKRAKHGIYGYTFLPPEYYDAIINWYENRYDWKLQKKWITFTPGVIPALNIAIQSFTKPQDKVVIQTPAYPPFFSAVRNNKRRRVLNSLQLINDHYEMDLDDLEKKINKEHPKILILCSPHNPTGRVWKKSELIKIGDICLENNILVISDEIHCDLVYPNYNHIPFASISEEFALNSITCTSISKSFNLPGLKLSNIIIPNQKLRSEFRRTCQRIGITQPNCFGPSILIAAYNKCEDWLNEVILYIQENLLYLKRYLNEHLPQLKVINPEGTYLVWIDFRNLGIEPKKLSSILLKKAKVALFEGYLFGKDGIGFNRINIACPRSILKMALERIVKAIKNELK